MPWEVVKGLYLTLYIAAARADCVGDPEKASQLKSRVLPALGRYRVGDLSENEMFHLVDEVMGPDWEPSGAWKDHLDSLGFERAEHGK